jgi:hypothetical protein
MGFGSGIRDPEKTILSRIQGSKRHRILDPNPQHWYLQKVISKNIKKKTDLFDIL